ncbi:MAG TPA: lysophospholipid acyltransferase family protein [Kineosporiaceae bacterium]|nr:lysophospholipid acyltransferase family protein [Kineosporiaceae bacterium]
MTAAPNHPDRPTEQNRPDEPLNERPVPEAPEVSEASYQGLLSAAAELYPGVRVGRPGRAKTYWVTIALLRVLRLGLNVRVTGADGVAPGPAILIANHVSALDPVVVVMSRWWRVTAFTKIEWFESRAAPFFRWMGQIPLRRGDDASTRWAMEMSRLSLAGGGMVGIYPEGTRSPDPTRLHRLHKRVMIPLLQANPDVPVHALAAAYHSRPGRRLRVTVRISPPLALDVRAQGADEITTVVRDALLEQSGQSYDDRYARDVKREAGG